MNNQELGLLGETLAKKHLIKLGHEILHQNWRFQHLEIDLITQHKNNIHFVEVKTRQTAEYGEPWMAVTRTKQKQLMRAADHYLKKHEVELDAVFDVVSIVHNSFRTDLVYLPDAFSS